MKATCTGCDAEIDVSTDYDDPFCTAQCLGDFYKRCADGDKPTWEKYQAMQHRQMQRAAARTTPALPPKSNK